MRSIIILYRNIERYVYRSNCSRLQLSLLCHICLLLPVIFQSSLSLSSSLYRPLLTSTLCVRSFLYRPVSFPQADATQEVSQDYNKADDDNDDDNGDDVFFDDHVVDDVGGGDCDDDNQTLRKCFLNCIFVSATHVIMHYDIRN